MSMIKGLKTLILEFGDKTTVFLDHLSECVVLCMSPEHVFVVKNHVSY